MSQKLTWDAPPLSAEDERLIGAYVSIGKSLDDLPYTAEFEKLFKTVGLEDTLQNRHATFKRLVRLRKTGRLPRLSGACE